MWVSVQMTTAIIDLTPALVYIMSIRGSERGLAGRSEHMELIVDEGAGFCFGVERAIQMTEKVARDAEDRVYTIGPLIHNPQVIEELKAEGVEVIAEDADVTDSVSILRTHGVSPTVEARLRKESKQTIDATCPYVKKSHQYAQVLNDEGYHILIVGDRNHPEIKGVLGYAGERVTVVNTLEEADNLPHHPKLEDQTVFLFRTFDCIHGNRRIECDELSMAPNGER